jgi:2-amino-4-hydroxy-6-hydroxymethyldihydropteridine diphosphokinase
MRYFLSLGSDLGDRKKNLCRALLLLEREGITVLKASSFYETQPVDFPSKSWFYNQVVEVKADIDPIALLGLVKKTEQKMGRKAKSQKSSRIIDIDILLAEKIIIQSDELEIPHPRMDKRNFVLQPFMEISPETIHPVLEKSIKDLGKDSKDRSIVKRL